MYCLYIFGDDDEDGQEASVLTETFSTSYIVLYYPEYNCVCFIRSRGVTVQQDVNIIYRNI